MDVHRACRWFLSLPSSWFLFLLPSLRVPVSFCRRWLVRCAARRTQSECDECDQRETGRGAASDQPARPAGPGPKGQTATCTRGGGRQGHDGGQQQHTQSDRSAVARARYGEAQVRGERAGGRVCELARKMCGPWTADHLPPARNRTAVRWERSHLTPHLFVTRHTPVPLVPLGAFPSPPPSPHLLCCSVCCLFRSRLVSPPGRDDDATRWASATATARRSHSATTTHTARRR